MSITIPGKLPGNFSQIPIGGLSKILGSSGRMPSVTIRVTPIDFSPPFTLDSAGGAVLTYNFSSSITIPVDTFSFTLVAPNSDTSMNEKIKEGDLVTIYANGVALSTGIIDTIDIETDGQFGERVMVSGRDLMGQLEDQDAVGLDSKLIKAAQSTMQGCVNLIIPNTRIQGVNLKNVPSALSSNSTVKFATEPGESKLAVLQRLIEPYNLLAWMSPNGEINIGKPAMNSDPEGIIQCSKKDRKSNVLSIKAIRSAATIPNAFVAIWAGQESVQDRVKKEQVLFNYAKGPMRLRHYGHILTKSVVTSHPDAQGDARTLAEVNLLKSVNGVNNLLSSLARRSMASHNHKELIVQAIVPGHYNEEGNPYLVDTVYTVFYDRGGVSEKMYLFQTDYSFDEAGGQKTSLYFCRLGTLVADVEAK